MKYSLKILTLFVVAVLVNVTLFSQVKTQNTFSISIDPQHASTVFINSERRLNVETWDEPYILFEVAFNPYTEAEEMIAFLGLNQSHIIQQEITINDFLYLTIPDLNKILKLNNCNEQELIYKITVPKSLDLELRCENDMSVYDPYLNDYSFEVEELNPQDEE